MKIYEILDDEKNSIGVLMYYEKKKDYIIELRENLDEWSAPLLFSNLVKRNIYTVPRNLSFLWVKERVIPSGRQNINDILKTHNIESYDEMKFLEISKGRCAQDNLYIKKIDTLPEYVLKRRAGNIKECVVCHENNLLCFFMDGAVKKINLNLMKDIEGVDKILKNEKLYQSCKVGTGGYSITFNDSIDISADILFERGIDIPLSQEDFLCFAKSNLLDTGDACEMLECSRQNIAYLIKQEQISVVKEDVKGNLYLKGDVIRNMW